MGIGKEAYRLLLDEKKKGMLKGESILQIGRQCILFDHQTLTKYSQKHNVALAPVSPNLSFDAQYRKLGFIDDLTLFQSLGFKDVKSLDYSDFEGADIVWDLNHPIPEKYWGQFDVIYDGGTAEHVFHFPQLLSNLHLLLKEGGVIIHVSPSHNHVDHGFYMFSPQVFSAYYSANRYEILTSQIFEYSPKYNNPWKIYRYQPGALDRLSYGGFGKKMLAIHLVVQKNQHSTGGVIPQQQSYLFSWNPENKPTKPKRKINPITRLGISLNKKIKRCLPASLQIYLEKRKLSKSLIFKRNI